MSRKEPDDWTYGQLEGPNPRGGTNDAVRKLQQAGYNSDQIAEIILSGNLQKVANTPHMAFAQGKSQPFTFDVTKLGAPIGGIANTLSKIGPALTQGIGPDFFRQLGVPKSDFSKASGGKAKPGNSAQNAINRAIGAAQKYQSIYNRFKNYAGSGNTDPSMPQYSGPEYTQYTPDAYSAPVLERRDFTDEANRLAAQAYSPMYAALQQGKQNATGQFNTSDAVVKGLYEKLGAEIAASSEKQKAGYAQAGQDAGNRYKALQDQIAQNYQAAQNNESVLMQQNGSQAAAGTVIPDDRAFAQNQAATTGAAQQDYYAKQGQAEGDYLTKLGLAGQQEGNVQRQQLVQQLAGVLNQYDQQNLTLQGQQSQSAMDIANRLSDQDFQMQQANAGLGLDQYNANTNAQLGAAQMQNQIAGQQYQRYRDQIGDSQFNRQQDLAEQKFRSDMAMGLAEQQGQSGGTGLKFDDLPPQQQIVAQADQLAGGQGQQYFDFINQFISGQNPDAFNLQTFSSAIAQAAASRGLNPAVAMAIAGSYWQRIMNRS